MAARIVFTVKNRIINPKHGEKGFNNTFKELVLHNHDNTFYKFSDDTLGPIVKPTTIYNGSVINFPIPEGLLDLENNPIINNPVGPNEKHHILPMLINVDKGKVIKEENHFCDDFEPEPEDMGTACVRFLQNPLDGSDSNTIKQGIDPLKYFFYFKMKKAYLFPNLKGGTLGSSLLNVLLSLYNLKYYNQDVFFLPTVAPNKTVIFIVSNNEDKIKGLIEEYFNNPQEQYFIGLNGIVYYIDQWNCCLFFDDDIVDKKGKTIKSQAEIHIKAD
jgi:hypothetical protein